MNHGDDRLAVTVFHQRWSYAAQKLLLMFVELAATTLEPMGWAIIGWSCHKYHFCRDKTWLLSRQNTNIFLSQQNVCRDRYLSPTNITNTCLSRQNKSFVGTKVCLSRQKFCRDKHIWVATKGVFVATNTCVCVCVCVCVLVFASVCV